jgi:uncharacterized protein (DUF58 family)
MALGSSGYSKKEALTYITGSILFSALSDQINTGFLAFADRVLVATPPRRTRAAAWSVLEQCWALSPKSRRTLMRPALSELLTTLKRMSVIFIVSDFMTDDDVFAGGELSRLATRHDLIAVIPEDPAEASLPAGSGYVRVRDVETGRQASVGLGSGARRRYEAEVKARRDGLARAFYRVPMDHVFVPTDQSPVMPVLSMFARRMNA